MGAFEEDLGNLLHAAFHSVYTNLQPTDAENRARFGQLMAVLTAEPSASVGFAQTMLQNVLKACAPAALQKTPDLQPLEQVDLEQLIDALGANLYRTEKKIQRGALRLLKLISTQYAGVSKAKRKKTQTAEQLALANYVADRVLEAYEVLPLELRGAAEACLPEDRLPQPEEAEAAGASVEVPSVLLPGVEPGNPSHPSRIWTSSAPSSRRNRTQTPVELPGTNLPALGERTWHVFTTLPRPTSWRRRISGSFVPCARSPANITTTTLRTCLFSAQY